MSPPVRPRGSTGLVVAVLAGVLVAALATAALATSAAATSAAAAEPTTPGAATASATPSPSPTPSPPSLDPLPSGAVTSFPLVVSGTAAPGEVVDVSGGSSSSAGTSCSATAAGDGGFRCALQRLPDGPGVPVRAVSRSTGLADSERVDVLTPPTITAAAGGATAGGIRGTAYPGATVTVTAETGATCTFPADSTGSWGCVIPGLRDGRHVVSATQVAPFTSTRSARSAQVTVVVDTVAPAAPTLTSPAPGATVAAGRTITFAGTGEHGATVTVYASTSRGTSVACTVTLTGSTWSCSAGLPGGGYIATALQRDTAGNVSAGSNAVAVTVEAAATAPSTARPAPAPAPAQPAPSTAVPSAPSVPAPPGSGGWTETPFTSASAPVATVASVPGWLRSVSLAIAALLLLVLPARLLAAALMRPREPREHRASVFGRNRASSELGEADALLGSIPARARFAWLAPVTGVAAAALVTLSTSVQDGAAYLRLLVAVSIAIAGVNALWVLAARGMARHLGSIAARPVVRPALLVVVAATAIGSRLLGLEPALLFGLVVGMLLPEGMGRVERGRTAAVQLSAVAAFGVLAWLAVGVLPPPSGDPSAFLLELVNSVSLVAIGSTAIALLPFGRLPGRAVLQWSRLLWLALGVVVYTVLFALLLPVASLAQAGDGVVAVTIAAVAFAVLSLSVWLWERYVEPAT